MKKQPEWQQWMEANARLYINDAWPVNALAVDASVKFGGPLRGDDYENYLDRLYFKRADEVFTRLGFPKGKNEEEGL